MNPSEFRTGVIKPVEIYKEAWELIKPQYWLVFAIVIVGILVGSVIPIILIGPAMCGIFMCLFCLTDGKPLKFEDLFKGFEYIWKSLPISLAIMVPVFVFLIVIYIPLIGVAVAGNKMSESELLPFIAGVLVFELIAAIVMVSFHTLLLFAFPLVADRGLSGIDAIKLSIKAVWQNLAGMAGLLGVGMVIAMVSYLALCIGVYFAMPIIIMGQAVAYRKIFPALPGAPFDPPAPSSYQGVSN
ncbi:MAG TPA: hypothetical protein PLP21_19360 [Pyrinomonadaceae bacterium]|nr:hypothetical protein [Acidobacteriota bacterium]HQZ98481.1 hypothetical protein [Pyrinomonadaceae bacterium]